MPDGLVAFTLLAMGITLVIVGAEAFFHLPHSFLWWIAIAGAPLLLLAQDHTLSRSDGVILIA